MADKEIKVKIKADADTTKLTALEHEVQKLKTEKIELKIQAKTDELKEAESKLESLKQELETINSIPPHLKVNVDDKGVKNLESEIASMERKTTELKLDVDMAELEAVKSEMKAIENDPMMIQMDNQNAMEAIGQIADGFSRMRQSASEVGQHLNDALNAQAKQDTNKMFLQNALQDSQKTESVMKNINGIIADLPGDDTALQGLLSSAVAMEPALANNDELLQNIANSSTDYFSAMSFYGKSSVEAQQDMTNYLLAGNTAELERSPILQKHIDKLKEANTLEERQKVLAEALNEEHWGGMGQAETLNNKMETFNSMLERGQYNLGGFFQEASMGAMDFILDLDESTNGIVGMGLALGGFASPIAEGAMGLGQIATGMKAIKDLEMLSYLKDLEIMTKLSAFADWALAGAQAVLNAVMALNPIILVAIALAILVGALIWAYYNVDWFREMVDNAWASIKVFASELWGNLVSAFNYVSGVISAFTNQIGLDSNNWIQAILGFILFIPTLPSRLGIALTNAIAHLLGFKGNFVQHLQQAGSNAVNGFLNYIRQLPGIVMGEFNRVLGMVNDFINTLPDRVWDMGVAIIDALKNSLGIHSPGIMYWTLQGEFQRINDLPENMEDSITGNVANLGQNIGNSFNPNMELGNTGFNGEMGANQINNFYFEDIVIDNEDRMKKIMDYITREMYWNNKTAGRTR